MYGCIIHVYSKEISTAEAIIVSLPHVTESGVKVNSGTVLHSTVAIVLSCILHPAVSSNVRVIL